MFILIGKMKKPDFVIKKKILSIGSMQVLLIVYKNTLDKIGSMEGGSFIFPQGAQLHLQKLPKGGDRSHYILGSLQKANPYAAGG